MKPKLVGTSAILLFILFSVSSSLCAEKRFDKKFTVTPGETFTLKTDVGSIFIRGASSKEVSIVAEIKGSERDVRDFEISATQTASGVDVNGRNAGGTWRFFGWNDLDVRFTVNVPHEYNVRTNTSGGEIEVRDLKGAVYCETSGGDIALADIEGGIRISTSGGQINLDRINGNVDAKTSGGDIAVGSTVGDVTVSTSGGNIRVSDVVGKVHAETSGGDVVVKVNGDNKGILAETSGGDIDVVVDPNVAATIDAETSGGDVSCDLPLTTTGKVNESRIRGSINGGGNTIRAYTSGGDIRIRISDASTKR